MNIKLLSKKDFAFSILTGLTAGLISWGVLSFLNKNLPFNLESYFLIPILPILWILGVQLGYFLGRWMQFFDQFGKYVAIGFTNFAVDTGVLSLLLSLTQTADGPGYALQKVISFSFGVTHSYIMNRSWAFESKEENKKSEFAKFIGVNLLAMAVNVGTAYAIVHFIPSTSTPEVLAIIGSVTGSAVALIFSFIGFKLVVFKKDALPNL